MTVRNGAEEAAAAHTEAPVHTSAQSTSVPSTPAHLSRLANGSAGPLQASASASITAPAPASSQSATAAPTQPHHPSSSGAENHHSNGHREHASSHSTPHRSERDRERRSRRTLGDYALGKTLGAGSMGKVKLAVRMGDGEKVAIKIIPRNTSVLQAQNNAKAAAAAHAAAVAAGEAPPEPPIGADGKPILPGRIPSAELARLAAKDAAKEVRTIREGSLQLLLHHPYVCGMREMMIHTNHYYMVFEYINGGQMLDYIISHGRLRERSARKFARQIGSALEYCHRNSIVHRDLKIENILISGSGNIKIIDFGLSNLFSPHSHLSTFCGSLYFAAPELLQAKVYTGPEVDVWSFGIVLYVLVNGKVPFDDQSMPALHAKIKRGQVEYPAWLSPECKHLLSRMLNTNPAQRATLPEVLAHPWMTKGFENAPDPHIPQRQPLRPDTLDPDVIKGMTGFEFGSSDDIQTRMLEILTSDTYLNVLRAWEARNGGVNSNASPSASSTAIGSMAGKEGAGSTISDSQSLNRQNTRSSLESGTSKMKNATKRFSGIDFYRKKIAGNGLFGGAGGSSGRETDDRNGSTGLGVNGSGNAHGGQWSGPGVKEPLDPTRGYHPLLSIYYLVAEKMDRERLYGANFFASSNVSVAGPPVPPKPLSPNLTDAAGAATGASTVGGSMPTAADIPQAQDALRVPEATRISKRGKDAISGAAAVTAPSKSSTGSPVNPSDGFTTPIFDSRQKSQPLPNMAGPPRARAVGDEVEAALRGSGSHHHHRHSAIPAMSPTGPTSGNWQQQQQQLSPRLQQNASGAGAVSESGAPASGHGLNAVLPPLPASASTSGHKRSLSLNMRSAPPGTDPNHVAPGPTSSASAGAAGGGISASSSAGSAGASPLFARPMARMGRTGGGSAAENRRSVHIMMTPRSANAAEDAAATQQQQQHQAHAVHVQSPSEIEAMEMVDNASSSPFGFGGTLTRRLGSLIGRSPSTPVDSDAREKRRLARMSTGGMFGFGAVPPTAGAGGPVAPSALSSSAAGSSNGPSAASPSLGLRRGSLHLGAALSGVAESRMDEEAMRISEANDTPPADPDFFDVNAGSTSMQRAGTAGPSMASPTSAGPETPTKSSSHKRESSGIRASVGRVTGKSLLSSSVSASGHESRRPFTAGSTFVSGHAHEHGPATPGSAGPSGPTQFPIPPVGTDGGWQGALTPALAHANALPTSSRREAVKPGAAMSAKPVFLKGLFSVQTTTTKSRSVIHADLLKVFERIGLPYREIQGGYECTYLPSLDFSGGSATAEAGKGYVQLEQTIDQPGPQAGPGYGGGADTSVLTTASGGTETLADLRGSTTVQSGGGGGGPGSTAGDDASSARGPRRRTSRMSFASSKKDRRTLDESAAAAGVGAGVGSTSSVGVSTTAAAPVTPLTTGAAGTAVAGAAPPRSRASSITADFENDSAVGAAQNAAVAAAAAATGGVTVAASPSTSGAALGTPTGAPGSPSPLATPATIPGMTTTTSTGASPAAHAAGNAVIGKSMSASVASRLTVQFEIFVVKVPLLLGVNGLQFRRVAGNTWQYQMLAKRVLQELKL
ncbi:hypothetical protein V8E36_003521 [Tilletia maclaganii]